MKAQIFISYSSANKDLSEHICEKLESSGLACWMAPRDINPGADWAEAIIDAIDEAKTMVVVFTTEANDSVQVKREIERAVSKNIAVLPLKLGDFTPSKSMEYFLSSHHWHILNRDNIDKSLVTVIQKLGGSSTADNVQAQPVIEKPAREKVNAPPPGKAAAFRKRSFGVYIAGAVVMVLVVMGIFIFKPFVKSGSQADEENSFMTPTDLGANTETEKENSGSSKVSQENINKVLGANSAGSGESGKIALPENIGDNLELFSKSDLAFDKKQSIKLLTMEKFESEEAPVNLMIGNVVDEQISIADFLDRLMSMDNTKIKIVKVNTNNNGRIKELFLESDQ